jgi:hypothetical protein
MRKIRRIREYTHDAPLPDHEANTKENRRKQKTHIPIPPARRIDM